VHRMAGSGSSSLLPTPNAADGMGGPGNSGRDGGLNQRTAAALLPTPNASDWKGPNRSGSQSQSAQGLPTVTESLLPTPTSRDHKGANQRSDETCLPGALLPTPRASDGTKGGPNQRGSSGDPMLPSAVAGIAANPSQAGLIARTAERLLPTPNASVVQDGEAFETWEARRKIAAEKHGNNGIGMPLTIAVQLLPTPSASDTSKHSGQPPEKRVGHTVRLTDVTEHLSGWNGAATNPRFDDGNES
jgi:hypothetical protein